MPSTSLEIRVSRREIDRPRLIEAFAWAADGGGVAGLALRLSISENGTFHEDAELTIRDAVTGESGHLYFQWYEFPRLGPRRDMTSVIVAAWEGEAVSVYLQDLYE